MHQGWGLRLAYWFSFGVLNRGRSATNLHDNSASKTKGNCPALQRFTASAFRLEPGKIIAKFELPLDCSPHELEQEHSEPEYRHARRMDARPAPVAATERNTAGARLVLFSITRRGSLISMETCVRGCGCLEFRTRSSKFRLVRNECWG